MAKWPEQCSATPSLRKPTNPSYSRGAERAPLPGIPLSEREPDPPSLGVGPEISTGAKEPPTPKDALRMRELTRTLRWFLLALDNTILLN